MPEAQSFSTMLMTPAIASDPYWAAAPSRSTSMRSIAAAGIALRSTPTVPRPNVPLTCTSALEWRRLPFTRSEEHTSELQSQSNLVCRLLLEKKKKMKIRIMTDPKPIPRCTSSLVSKCAVDVRAYSLLYETDYNFSDLSDAATAVLPPLVTVL